MNLAIDIGNSRTKLGVFQDGKLVKAEILDSSAKIQWPVLFKKYGIKNTILSTVAAQDDGLKTFLGKNSFCIVLDSRTPLPIKNLYKTPLTLGKDRIAAAAGAFALFPGENILVVDVGTAITYEFINAQGEYHGGGISPGMLLRFRALNTFTTNLPLIDPEPVDYITGKSTKESILSGVINGIRMEIDGFIEAYQAQLNVAHVLLTGGDAAFFEATLKNKIFAVPNLVLIGLNKILEHNVSLR
ncbi:MAG: type III pantothenate kinase [Chitinophagales bacterium]|nr:MAG: type III pantothenate kinase [Chitinophagales bacterium]